MPKTTGFANSILALIFNGTSITGLARDAASPLTNLYVSLHTANPGVGGAQNTSEATYTGYARVAVARPAGWVVTSNVLTPLVSVIFPVGSGGGGTAKYMGIGTASSGAGVLLYSGSLSPDIIMGSGITPKITGATTLTET